MRPYPEEILKAIQLGAASHLLPELQSNYARAQFTFAMLLFTIAQRDYDTAVPDLIAQNEELRTLIAELGDGLSQVTVDSAATARVELETLPAAASTLRLSDLRGENEALRGAIARLAPIIEPAADDDALTALRAARTKIYDFLKADAKRRIVPILTA